MKFQIEFTDVKTALPELVRYSDSYGGCWGSEYCIVLLENGRIDVARLEVRVYEKEALDRGEKPHIDWRSVAERQLVVAWAYTHDVRNAYDSRKEIMMRS